MRRIWETKDIMGGRYVVRCSAVEGSPNHGFLSTVTYQIGYSHTFNRLTQYTLNSLSDGWVHGDLNILSDRNRRDEGYSKEALCTEFNNDIYGYRPATKEDIINIINYSNKNFITEQDAETERDSSSL